MGEGNFLSGREFADDVDLAQQCAEWLDYANGVTGRPSQATDVPPVARLAEEAAKGGPLPASARDAQGQGDYGFLHPARVSPEALVPVLGNQYSVPIVHVGAPVAVRVHREHIVIWRDTTRLAEHARAPDGAHQRVVEPQHYSLRFAKKPRAQVMLYREALTALGPTAKWYLSEVSHRRRTYLREEVVGIYTLYQQLGAERLLAAMDHAIERSAYGVDYLRALIELVERSTPAALAAAPNAAPKSPAGVMRLPMQDDVDRALDVYERYVQIDGDLVADVDHGEPARGPATRATISGEPAALVAVMP